MTRSTLHSLYGITPATRRQVSGLVRPVSSRHVSLAEDTTRLQWPGADGRETGVTTGAQPSNNSDTYHVNQAVSFILPRIQMRDNETLSFYNFSTSDEIDTALRRSCGTLAQMTGAATNCMLRNSRRLRFTGTTQTTPAQNSIHLPTANALLCNSRKPSIPFFLRAVFGQQCLEPRAAECCRIVCTRKCSNTRKRRLEIGYCYCANLWRLYPVWEGKECSLMYPLLASEDNPEVNYKITSFKIQMQPQMLRNLTAQNLIQMSPPPFRHRYGVNKFWDLYPRHHRIRGYCLSTRVRDRHDAGVTLCVRQPSHKATAAANPQMSNLSNPECGTVAVKTKHG